MIAAVSLMKRRSDVTDAYFRKHWLDPHGVMTAELPRVRYYVQHHVVESPHTNALAKKLEVIGFAELWFDSYEDRKVAYTSKRIAECNVDSEQFIGAVTRLVTEPREVMKAIKAGARAIAVNVGDRTAGETWAEGYQRRVTKLPGVTGYMRHKVLEQAAAPNSKIPEFELAVAGFAEVVFEDEKALAKSVAELAGKNGNVALYVVEDHRLV